MEQFNKEKQSDAKVLETISPSSGLGLVKPLELQAGTLISFRYRVVGLLGKGAMGRVYEVEDTRNSGGGAPVRRALKISCQKSPDFLREALLVVTAARRNQHIVRPVDVGHDEALDIDYFVMEYVEGEALGKIYKSKGRFTEQEGLVVALEVCQALQTLEANGILHGDIKPMNVMLNNQGDIQVTDFGIAMRINQGMPAEDAENRNIAELRPKSGTPLYESPEQFKREAGIDSRADIFSLGATLFELMTGQHPYPGKTAREVLEFRARHAVPTKSPQEIVPGISREFSDLIMQMMAEKPSDRPGNCVILKQRLLELGCPGDARRRADVMLALKKRKPLGRNRNDGVSGKKILWVALGVGFALLAAVACTAICKNLL